MSLAFYSGIIAGVFALLGYARYVYTIRKGESRPKPSTWLIWSIIGIITVASMFYSGSTDTLWTPIAYMFCFIAVFMLSLRQQGIVFDAFDRLCIALAVLSIITWWLTSNPLYALLISLFADFLGALPTIRKLLLKQGGEDVVAWALMCIGNVFNIFAISSWEFSEFVYPVYMLKINVIILALIIINHKKTVQHATEKSETGA